MRNFRILHWGFASPQKAAPEAVFWVGVFYQHTAQTAQFWVIEIISGASRHAKDVAFVVSFDEGCTVWAL